MARKKSRKQKSRSTGTSMPARPMKLWQDDSNNQDVRIEILPLMDVIFCILTFFILSGVGFSRQQAINFDLPKASTATYQQNKKLVVSLDDFGQIYVDKQPVANNTQLYQLITSHIQFNPNQTIALYASKNTSYNEVIQVLDLLREMVGIEQVALATLPGEPRSTSNLNPNFNPNSNTNLRPNSSTNITPNNSQVPGNSVSPLPGNFSPLPNQQQPNNSQLNPNPLDSSNSGVPQPPNSNSELNNNNNLPGN